MADLAPIWSSFNAGELSPLLDGRTDQEKYFSGAKVMQNFIPTVQGPVMRRGGTRYIGNTKGDGKAWFIPFEFSSAQSYVLEFGENYIRFWVNRGQLQSGMAPYEIVSPWTLADLTTDEGTLALHYTQSGDIMWIVSSRGDKKAYKLSRLGATNWTLTEVLFRNGPFADIDPFTPIMVAASVQEGDGFLFSSAPLFRPSDVGTSFFLETQTPGAVAPWKVDTTTVAGAVRRYDGNVYRAVAVGSTGKTGVNPPVHLSGDALDGPGGVTWRYLHSGYGWVRITSFESNIKVGMTVLSYLPVDLLGNYVGGDNGDDPGTPSGGSPPPVYPEPEYPGGSNALELT